MKAIVVVDKFWGIGKNNDLLFCLKEDMKHFMQHTLNKVVVMGGNTLRSFPNGKPLKNRTNIVLTSSKPEGCTCVLSLEELFNQLKQFNTNDVYVVGGASVYRTLLPYCNEAVVTKVNADGKAEVFFPNLDKDKNWECVGQSAPVIDGDYSITFCTYKNNKGH